MQELIVGLILAGAAALAWLAYTHPVSYRRVHFWVQVTAYSVFLLIMLWNSGVLYGSHAVIQVLIPEGISDLDKLEKARDAMMVPTFPAMFSAIGLSSYSLLLSFLRIIFPDEGRA